VAYSFRVGTARTHARFRLRSPVEVLQFLAELAVGQDSNITDSQMVRALTRPLTSTEFRVLSFRCNDLASPPVAISLTENFYRFDLPQNPLL